MSFDYSNTSKNYLTKRYNFILQIEESGTPKLHPYNDGKGWVTIGAGYNLSDANVRSKVLTAMGITDPTLIDQLNTYLKKQYTGVANITIRDGLNNIMKPATFGFTSPNQVRDLFNGTNGTNGLAQDYEKLVDKWATKYGLGTIPPSRERTALLSLAWNSPDANGDGIPDLLGDHLATAMAKGDRAAAWFEIAFASNKKRNFGAENRRLQEAGTFGLFKDQTPTAAEAKTVFDSLTAHYGDMQAYLKSISHSDGTPLSQTELDGYLSKIESQLTAGKNSLLADLEARQLAGLSGNDLWNAILDLTHTLGQFGDMLTSADTNALNGLIDTALATDPTGIYRALLFPGGKPAFRTPFDQSKRVVCPIILDLDGNGIEIVVNDEIIIRAAA